MTAKHAVRLAVAFAAAVASTAVLGSIVQTQINLAAIVKLGADVPMELRLATTAEDILRFSAVMAAIAAAAFLPALIIAVFAVRALPAWRDAIIATACMAGLWTAFSVMGFFTPMPTLVAAVRGDAGLAAMCATGVAGGVVFARLSRRAIA